MLILMELDLWRSPTADPIIIWPIVLWESACGERPGTQSKQGLYYYYNVFGKALQVWGQDTITDAQGRRHNWREDLIAKLISLQRQDGTWLNTADRWYEGNPHYITALAVLSMQAALQK